MHLTFPRREAIHSYNWSFIIMTTEATQSGAENTLEAAANAFENILDANKAVPSDDINKKKQPGQKQESQPSKADSKIKEATDSDNVEEEELDDSNEESKEADAETQYELPQSLEQLAESMGVDVNTLLSMKARAKIDGQESDVALADLIKSYQLEGHLNKKSMALSEQRKAFEDEAVQLRNALNQQVQEAQTMLQFLNSELVREYNSVNWDELRQTDPAEYAARVQDFNLRQQQFQAYRQNVAAYQQNLTYQQQQQQTELLNKVYQNETDALLNAMPEWKDSNKAKEGRQKLREYLTQNGYKNEELNTVLDHRAVVIANKAMLYDNLMKSKPAVEKKLVNLPRVMKPGTVKTKADINAERNKVAINKLRKSGSIHDAASAFKNLLN